VDGWRGVKIVALLDNVIHGRVYHGWAVVFVGFLAGFVKASLTGFLFSVFLKPMSEEFGWSRSLTTGAVTVGTVIAALTGFSFGSLLDRYGARVLFVGGAVVMGLALVGLSQVSGLWQFYVAYIIGRLMAFGPLGDAFIASATAQWFIRKRGRAIAIAMAGPALGGAALAMLAGWIITTSGWRNAWFVMGVLTWVLVLLPAWLLVRRRPEDMGLLPDGDSGNAAPSVPSHGVRHATQAPPVSADDPEWTVAEATRTRAFWLLSIVAFFHIVTTSAIVFNMVSSLTDRGFSTALAIGALSLYALLQGLSQIIWGGMADRLPVHVAYAIALATSMVGLGLIGLAASPVIVYAAVVVFGLGQGGVHTVGHTVWPAYFGRRNVGSIRGVSLLFETTGNAFGPFLGALVYDLSGSYAWAFVGVVVTHLVIVGFVYRSRRPVRATPAVA